MSPALSKELHRLREILATVDMELKKFPGATEEKLQQIQQDTGITLDADLCDLWRFSDGLSQCFMVMTDEPTTCDLPSLEESRETWSSPQDPDEAERTDEFWDKKAQRDPRIQKGFFLKSWFPFAEFNGFSTSVYFDASPTSLGHYGQIIAYQHDPDAVYYVADNFIEFFRKSNALLANNLTRAFFMEDEFERICHMKGLAELHRQLKNGLDPEAKNWEDMTLSQFAEIKKRNDIVEFLRNRQ